jgi:hypothetical protein
MLLHVTENSFSTRQKVQFKFWKVHSVSLLFKDICDVYIYKDISTAEVCSIKWTVIGYINVKDKFGELCQEVIMFLNKNKLCVCSFTSKYLMN